MFDPAELSEMRSALGPVRDKLARERGIYGTSEPLPHMGRRVEVPGVGLALVRQHEEATDRRLRAIDSALAKIDALLDAPPSEDDADGDA